jgi:DNA repair exonuclease SbcCD ATPase subunit
VAKSYEDALAELYQSPHETFVAVRKRLSGELKSAGDTAGAARFAKLSRPNLSAWTVNQLWWQARPAFEALLATAQRLRDGDLGATAGHRNALAKLRARAATLLSEAGHAATEATLRRVLTTLSALAASGGFDPDRPGALQADRDPPGFEAIGVIPERPAPTPRRTARESPEALAERRKLEQERARHQKERDRLEAALRSAERQVEGRLREIDRLRQDLTDAEQRLEQAQASVAEAKGRLAELDAAD